jgi:hypothetical protein
MQRRHVSNHVGKDVVFYQCEVVKLVKSLLAVRASWVSRFLVPDRDLNTFLFN